MIKKQEIKLYKNYQAEYDLEWALRDSYTLKSLKEKIDKLVLDWGENSEIYICVHSGCCCSTPDWNITLKSEKDPDANI